CCVDSTTHQLIIPSSAEETAGAPLGIPIWDHGTLQRAQLTLMRHAVHLMRHLEDFHEPTLAAQCRRQLRRLAAADPAERAEARRAAASAFLAAPVRWRAVVEMALHLATLRAIEDVLGQRLLLKDEGGRLKDEEDSDCNARFSLHPSSFILSWA